MKIRTKKSLLAVRALLLVLILANMCTIFLMSAQGGEESGNTSRRVTTLVARVLVWDLDERPDAERERIVEALHGPVRTAAHMAEFGCLAALTLLFLATWQKKRSLQVLASLLFTFLYACTDECHQLLTGDGRAAQWSDIAVDMLGACVCCAFVCLLLRILPYRQQRKEPKLKTTRYYLNSPRLSQRLRIAVASDLHGMHEDAVAEILRRERPDLILIPGDLMEDLALVDPSSSGYAFLRACAELAPTFYSFGNHEIGCYHKGKPWAKPTPSVLPAHVKDEIAKTGAVLLDDESVALGELRLCGLRSGLNGKTNAPNAEALKRFAAEDGFRILLCHHPEYFVPHIKSTGIELTVCGHAHGGQWRIFGRGVFAPGQGIFPRYTSGVLEDRCVISRGIGNHTRYPRIFNAPEVVMVYYGYTPEEIEIKATKKKENKNGK